LLGDFGAASFLAPQDRQQAIALQRLEVRAFACLLEELLERCSAVADSRLTMEALVKLKTACMQELTSERPLFDAVEQVLMKLARSHQERQSESATAS